MARQLDIVASDRDDVRNESSIPDKECNSDVVNRLSCGLIMPISGIGECSSSHWDEVRNILESSIESAGFACRMVSDDDGIGIIQDRIVKNIYNSDIVVCDVSCKNPNVMFELGMRLAFDKSVVIVKDDKTDYSFDTSPVEHLTYPRDLRFQKIIKFQGSLSDKLKSTYKLSTEEGYSSFLKNFGQFSVAKIENKEVPVMVFLNKIYDKLQGELSAMRKTISSLNSKKILNENSNGLDATSKIKISQLYEEEFLNSLRDCLKIIDYNNKKKDKKCLALNEIMELLPRRIRDVYPKFLLEDAILKLGEDGVISIQ